MATVPLKLNSQKYKEKQERHLLDALLISNTKVITLEKYIYLDDNQGLVETKIKIKLKIWKINDEKGL